MGAFELIFISSNMSFLPNARPDLERVKSGKRILCLYPFQLVVQRFGDLEREIRSEFLVRAMLSPQATWEATSLLMTKVFRDLRQTEWKRVKDKGS